MKRALAPVAALVAAISASPILGASSVAAASAGETIAVNADFSWNGVRNCEEQRPGSVICIAAQATIDRLGLVEYARDAVPNGQTTPDGCPEYSTQGVLWVPGGTAKFDGAPVLSCGANDSPDAHYTLTLRDGMGVLAGATGTADVVADNGVDRWHGSVTLASAGAHSSSELLRGGVAGGAVLAGAAAAFFLRRRSRQPVKTA